MAKTERTSRQNLNASRNGSNANRQVSAGSKNQDLTKMNKQNREYFTANHFVSNY